MTQSFTLCWDCKRATGGCSWADSLKPVEGWTAKHLKANGSKPYDTYVVYECPEFIRDSVGNGLKRYKEIKDEHEEDKSDSIYNSFARYCLGNHK